MTAMEIPYSLRVAEALRASGYDPGVEFILGRAYPSPPEPKKLNYGIVRYATGLWSLGGLDSAKWLGELCASMSQDGLTGSMRLRVFGRENEAEMEALAAALTPLMNQGVTVELASL